ncbi:MAG: peptidylprolyl isomerase, partial [Candidatus Pacebacteria bacterium]|nr:peptidylprolyl isomerase [Candidatus Paceibacterota bacterium]
MNFNKHTTEENIPPERTEKKVKMITVILAFAIIAMIYIITIGVLIWFFGFSKSDVVRKTAAIVPYPAAIVGTNVITFNKLMTELDAARQFYQGQNFSALGLQVDFSTPDGQKKIEIKKREILEKLIENAVIENEAKKRGITLSSADVNQEVNTELQKYGSEDNLKNTMQKLYGWNISQFEENIVKPDLYAQKLFADIEASDPSYAAAKAKITQAQDQLNNNADFSTVADQFSDGATAKNGGELGWFGADQMLPEVSAVITKMKVGSQSEIIQSSIGYHIVRLEDEKTENNVSMYKVSQIFVRTKSFSDWIADLEKQDKIWIPIREFEWSNQTDQVEFRDPAMQDL